METAELTNSFKEAPPFNGVLDTVEGHPRQPQKVLRKSICKVQKVLCKNVYSNYRKFCETTIAANYG